MSARINWNPTKLKEAEERAEKRYLFRAGGFIRQIVRRSIRRVKWQEGKIPPKSKPGRPPYSHDTNWSGFQNLRDSIAFNVDTHNEEVIVGPVLQQEKIGKLHEFGGTTTVKTAKNANKIFKVGDIGPVASGKFNNEYVSKLRRERMIDPVSGSPVIFIKLRTVKQAEHATRLNRRLQMKYHAESHTARYPARPYMRPGLEKAEPRLAEFWYNTIRE
ncbi:MAG: hypothetical protein PHV59_09705 [Victivallales bacterium]|nr:hypothetical protein [Victivallales bacterium]